MAYGSNNNRGKARQFKYNEMYKFHLNLQLII